MSSLRFIPVAVAIAAASTMIACTTAPPMAMPMAAAPGQGMASPERMAAMDARMKAMREMHAKMKNARTPEERQAMMAEHMTAMQGGMGMMKGMGGMGMMKGMGGMADHKGMSAEMAEHHKMMSQHMEMMQMMMDMMAQRMPPAARQ